MKNWVRRLLVPVGAASVMAADAGRPGDRQVAPYHRAQHEIEGLTVPNAHDVLPLIDKDPSRPNEAYFKHVDFVMDRGQALGLHVVDQSIVKAAYVRQSWFDPRYGVSYEFRLSGRAWDQQTFQTYTPPTSGRGQDWILVLEATAKPTNTPAPPPGN